jgi:hypothetical protein
VQGLFNDGRTSRAHPVRVEVVDETLVFATDGETVRWPLAAVRAEVVDDRVRISLAAVRDHPARLNLSVADWRQATAEAWSHHRAERRRHIVLVSVLAASRPR